MSAQYRIIGINQNRWYYECMKKVRSQIQDLHSNASRDEQDKMILGVGRMLAALTVKGMAMDQQAMETVVRAALREPRNSPMALTKSIQDIFDARRTSLAGTTVDLSRLSNILNKRDFAAIGTHASHTEIKDLAFHLCNELNNLPILSTPVLAIVNQVNRSEALGCSTEEWTLKAWKTQFSTYEAKTPRGADLVIFGLTQLHQKSPSLAQAARPDGLGLTELVHSVANHPLAEELRSIETSAQGNVVRALFQGDYEDARTQVLRHRDFGQARTIIAAPNLDTSELDRAGLSM